MKTVGTSNINVGMDFGDNGNATFSVGQEWKRYSISNVHQNYGGSTKFIDIVFDSASGVYIWGLQCENGSHPTSYIPTSGTTMTRGNEYAVIDGEDFTDFYNPVDAFPSDSILSAPDNLMQGNVDVPATQIDNSVSGNLVNTSTDTSLSRMNMASTGENTGPSTFGSSTFGSGTERVESGLSNVERQRRAAIEDGGDAASAVASQANRDANESDMRSDLQRQTDADDGS